MDILFYILAGISALAMLLAVVYVILIFPAQKKPAVSKRLHKAMYAHRGYHNKEGFVYENTLEAFELAVQKGFGIEFDINLSKDKQPVIMHDDSLKRMCGVDVKISESLYDDIKDININDSDSTIPHLSNVLSVVDGKVPLLIELKTVGDNYCELCEAVFELLDGYNGDFSIESFDPRVLVWLKKHRPSVTRGQLSCFISTKSTHGKRAILLRNLMMNFMAKPHFVAYRFKDRSNFSFKLNKLFGAQIYYWTIKNKNDAKKAISENGAIIFEAFDPID